MARQVSWIVTLALLVALASALPHKLGSQHEHPEVESKAEGANKESAALHHEPGHEEEVEPVEQNENQEGSAKGAQQNEGEALESQGEAGQHPAVATEVDNAAADHGGAAEQEAAEQEAAEGEQVGQAGNDQRGNDQKASSQKTAELQTANQEAAEVEAAEQGGELEPIEQEAAEAEGANQKGVEKGVEKGAGGHEGAEQEPAEQGGAVEEGAEPEAAGQEGAEQEGAAAEQEGAEQEAGEAGAEEAGGQGAESQNSFTFLPSDVNAGHLDTLAAQHSSLHTLSDNDVENFLRNEESVNILAGCFQNPVQCQSATALSLLNVIHRAETQGTCVTCTPEQSAHMDRLLYNLVQGLSTRYPQQWQVILPNVLHIVSKLQKF